MDVNKIEQCLRTYLSVGEMEKEKVDYILAYYSHLMTFRERAAWKHWATHDKMDNSNDESVEQREKRRSFYYHVGWLTKDAKTLDLLSDGIESFRMRTAERILKDEPIRFNDCQKCGKLTRTPLAKQCRYCGHDWH